jgi:hypothetical protein
MKTCVVVKIESYDGEDTHLHCGDEVQDFLFCIVLIDGGATEIVDNGYRSYAEAIDAWPQAAATEIRSPTRAEPPKRRLPRARRKLD